MKITYISTKKINFIFLCSITLLLALFIAPVTVWSAAPIKDEDITVHVESELRMDPAIPFNDIDVSTNQGVVMLTGNVSNILAKERATRIAQIVRGVRSVVNQIEIEPSIYRSAQLLEDMVKKALLYDAAIDSYQITVKADEKGQITLNGTVDSWAERNLAETAAKGVSGVVSVNNNIGYITKSKRPDTEIMQEIEKRLLWNALVDSGMINVNVINGKVSLTGSVGSAAEKRLAELNAWISGVSEVDASDLKVEKWRRDPALRKQKYVDRSDEEILAAVQDAMLYDPRVSSFNIEAKVNDGYVTLRGVVDNIQARKAAISDARHTVGVKRVNSLLKVRPLQRLEDATIAANVRAALLRNPYTESYEIKIDVQNGVVRLTGEVDTSFEKAEAENVAQRTSGVTLVRNFLVVRGPDVITSSPYVDDWFVFDFPWFDDSRLTTSKSDWEIKMDIEDELLWSPFVDVNDVDAKVNAGVVTLTGTVDSWLEYSAAQENAYDGGAISVINKLTIK